MLAHGYQRMATERMQRFMAGLTIACLAGWSCGRTGPAESRSSLDAGSAARADAGPGPIDAQAEIAAYRLLAGERLDVLEVFFEDGSPQARREVLRDSDGMVNHGLFQTWHFNGQIAEEGFYFKGRKHGTYTVSSDTGLKQSEVHYRRGVRDGLALAWGDLGALRERAHYADGVLDGSYESWTGAKPLSRGTYRAGLEAGEWTYWYTGQEQVKEQGSFVAGTKEGHWQTWHDNGALRSEGTFAAGNPHGRTVEFDPQGRKLAERSHVEGLPVGLQIEWYPNGAKRSEAAYVGGKPEGRQTQWYEDGQIRAQGELSDGKRQGRWAYYNPDGTVNEAWTGVYESDQRVSG